MLVFPAIRLHFEFIPLSKCPAFGSYILLTLHSRTMTIQYNLGTVGVMVIDIHYVSKLIPSIVILAIQKFKCIHSDKYSYMMFAHS